MSFLNPAAFGLGILLPVIVVFYLLKLRREERAISSTYLWQKMVRDMQANAPWQRLQRNLLLLLQLLFLIAIILAAARPFLWAEGISSQAVILIFDISASMGASDVEPSRIGAAKAEAINIVDRLPGEARITLISAGEKPQTLISLSADRHLAYKAIEEIQAAPGGSELEPALQIAAAIARRQPDSQTIIFTDGNGSLPERTELQGSYQIKKYGTSDANQGIAMLSLERDPADSSLTAFAQVGNYGSTPAERRITFYADGALLNASDLTIEAHSSQPVVVSGILSSTLAVEARLSTPEEASDYLNSDDRAYVVSREPESFNVVLVSPGNIFLETALSLIPEIDLELLDPGSSIDPEASLVIYDRSVPDPNELPEANLLFVAPPTSTEFFTRTGELDLPIPILNDPIDPLVEDIDLSSVSILESSMFSIPFWLKPLIVDAGGSDPPVPLVFAGEMENRRIGVLAFDLTRTDLPLQVSFPILISRMLTWLAPTGIQRVPTAVAPGELIALDWNDDGGDPLNSVIQVTRPDGTAVAIDMNAENPVFTDTSQPGIYTVELPNRESAFFAVNLFSPQESNIAPGSELVIAGSIPEQDPVTQQQLKQEWWRLAAFIGLLLLLVEWMVFHRATVLRLWRDLARRFNSTR